VPTPDDPMVVSIGLSQPKSMEERIYLRWSTDGFITSHLIEAEGIRNKLLDDYSSAAGGNVAALHNYHVDG